MSLVPNRFHCSGGTSPLSRDRHCFASAIYDHAVAEDPTGHASVCFALDSRSSSSLRKPEGCAINCTGGNLFATDGDTDHVRFQA